MFHPTHGEGGTPHFTEAELAEMREEARDRRGLYGKFVVFKADENGKIVGEPISDFFVLRPRKDVHALEALKTYARSASYEMSTRRLAHDLAAWIDDIESGPPDRTTAL